MTAKHIIVPGTPMGKPRMTRRDKWAKRPCVMRYREWADVVRKHAGEVPPANEVASLIVNAYFTPPKSWSASKRIASIMGMHRQKPDASNILKGLEDILWPDDDSALADVHVRKWWGDSDRVEILIIAAPY